MKKPLIILLALFVLSLFSCGGNEPSVEINIPEPLSEHDVISLKSEISKITFLGAVIKNFEVGQVDKSQIIVDYDYKKFYIEDIEFISESPDVATFEYVDIMVDMGNRVYIDFEISALSVGTTVIYAQTKDGIVQSTKINISVNEPVEPVEETEEIEKTEIVIDLVTLTERAVNSAIRTASAEKENVKINPHYEYENKHIILIYLKGQDNLTKNMIRGGMFKQARDIFKSLQERDDIFEISVFWSFPLVDNFGNSKEANVMKITLDNETLQKINFDTFDYYNFPVIADSYFEHTVLSN